MLAADALAHDEKLGDAILEVDVLAHDEKLGDTDNVCENKLVPDDEVDGVDDCVINADSVDVTLATTDNESIIERVTRAVREGDDEIELVIDADELS